MDDIHIITRQHQQYPRLLNQIIDAPEALYIRGNKEALLSHNCLAVVGSRKASSYGKQVAEQLLPVIAQNNITLVSGLAFGIDSIAHQVSVKENKPTIAVLGSGIDDKSIYPRPNLKLAHQIIATGGVLISEYEPGAPPMKHHFPARNRIVAGICQATLLIQANEKSGSLITAKLALDYNREVGAVPGPITDQLSSGTNRLLREGAHMILESQDLLDIFGITAHQAAAERQRALPLNQQKIIDFITHEPRHIDELLVVIEKPVNEVTTLLLELELSGHIQHVGGMKYVRKS